MLAIEIVVSFSGIITLGNRVYMIHLVQLISVIPISLFLLMLLYEHLVQCKKELVNLVCSRGIDFFLMLHCRNYFALSFSWLWYTVGTYYYFCCSSFHLFYIFGNHIFVRLYSLVKSLLFENQL